MVLSPGSDFLLDDETPDLSQFLNISPSKILSRFSQWVPNVVMSEIESELYFNFIHQFMPSVSLQYADDRLNPQRIWTPLASHSEFLREVYLSCGASQLAYKYPDYERISIERYNKSVRMLSNEISKKNVEGTEDWFLAAILALCLRDRAAGYNGSRCALHLVAAYKIIVEREKRKLKEMTSIDLTNDDEINIGSDTQFMVTPTERTFVESFIFNYCIVLYTCSYESLIKLPSPFTVFVQMSAWIKAPIYKDVAVTWMNNPILGSSALEFEVISKLVWLLRFHYCVDPADSHYVAEDLFWRLITSMKSSIDSLETSFQQEKISIELAENKTTLQISLSVSIIMFQASKILFQKLVNPSLPASFPLVQNCLRLILQETTNIPSTDHSLCLCMLALYIAGAACVTEQDKEYLTKILVDLSDLLRSNFGLNVLGILQRSWAKEQANHGASGYKSFNMLFERDQIELISF